MFPLPCGPDGGGDSRAGFVHVLDPAGRDPQTGRGRCAAPRAQPRLHGPQGLPRPRQTHVAEQPRRQRVPLRAACRIVTHGHAPPQPGATWALEWCVPPPGTTPLTSPRIRQDPEWPGLGGPRAPDVLPPVRHRPHGTRGRLRRGSHLDRTRMALPIVEPIGHRASEPGAGEVRHGALHGVLTPGPAGVFASPTPCVLLRVHTHEGSARRRTRGVRRFTMVAWPITIRMGRPGCLRCHVAPQRVVRLVQHAADGRRAGRLTRWRQPMPQLAQTPADPRPLAPRVTRRGRRDQVQACRCHPRVFCAARGQPAPSTRTRSVGRSARDPASSCRPRLIGCGSRPVMCAIHGSPPWPRRLAAMAASHRRGCASRRDRHTCMGCWRPCSGWGASCGPCGPWQLWTSGLGLTRSPVSADRKQSTSSTQAPTLDRRRS